MSRKPDLPERYCLACNKKLFKKVRESSSGWKRRKFCSQQCSGMWKTINTKGKNNGNWKGGKTIIQCAFCGKGCEFFPSKIRGRKKKFCSRKCMGHWEQENIRGEKNHWWRGGVSPINKRIRESAQYRTWRKLVFERDSYTCTQCFAHNGNGKHVELNADHIKSFALFPKLRFDLTNGRTLCVPCHKETENWGVNI